VDGLISRRQLSLELALALLARVREEAEARDLALASAVVDSAGHVLASQRMDGAALGAMQLAVGKAFTAASRRRARRCDRRERRHGPRGRGVRRRGSEWARLRLRQRASRLTP
jgi:uncharacterized protein GlcG (DUF336 family)